MKISREYKIGAFVVCVIALAFFIINWLRGADVFGKEIDLSSSFDNVESLLVSDPVYIKGYKAGRVDRIVYNPSTDKFDVTCSVDGKFRIPEDSKLTIYSIDIMGGKGVRIDLGTSPNLITKSATLASTSDPDMIGSIAEGLGPLVEKMTFALDSLSVTIASVNSLLSSDNATKISNTLSHLDRTVSNLEKLSTTVNGKSSDIESIIDEISSLSGKLSNVAYSAGSAVDKFSNMEDSISEDLLETIKTLKELSLKLSDPNGSVGKLLDNTSVFDNLENLLSDIDTLVGNITANPKKYLKIKVF